MSMLLALKLFNSWTFLSITITIQINGMDLQSLMMKWLKKDKNRVNGVKVQSSYTLQWLGPTKLTRHQQGANSSQSQRRGKERWGIGVLLFGVVSLAMQVHDFCGRSFWWSIADCVIGFFFWLSGLNDQSSSRIDDSSFKSFQQYRCERIMILNSTVNWLHWNFCAAERSLRVAGSCVSWSAWSRTSLQCWPDRNSCTSTKRSTSGARSNRPGTHLNAPHFSLSVCSFVSERIVWITSCDQCLIWLTAQPYTPVVCTWTGITSPIQKGWPETKQEALK